MSTVYSIAAHAWRPSVGLAGFVIGAGTVALLHIGVTVVASGDRGTLVGTYIVAMTPVVLAFAYFLRNLQRPVTLELHADGLLLRGTVWGEPRQRVWTWRQTRISAQSGSGSDRAIDTSLVVRHKQWGRMVVRPLPTSSFPEVLAEIHRLGGTVELWRQ